MTKNGWRGPYPHRPSACVFPGRFRERYGRCSAGIRGCQCVRRPGRLIHDGFYLVVVPAIGIVIHDDNCRALPTRLVLEEIQEFTRNVCRPQGRSRHGLRLEKAHHRKVPGRDCREEVSQIVLMIGRTIVANLSFTEAGRVWFAFSVEA